MTTTLRALEALIHQVREQSKVKPDEPFELYSTKYSLTAMKDNAPVGAVYKPQDDEISQP